MEPEIAKLLAGVGAILAAISPVNRIVGIVGVVLFLVGAISLADFYGDQNMRNDAIYWFIFIFIGLVALMIGAVAGAFSLPALFTGHLLAGGFGLAAFIATLVIAWILFVVSARRFRNMMSSMAGRSGENLFQTAGSLYYWGAVLTIILVGFILIAIAFILAGIAFLVMKTPTKTQT
ncbi:DUF996 domain-containing protein [Thermoproteus uzoniensis]|nr:DUF996 domain-containing protein [Thermoproteus uzoniensis]